MLTILACAWPMPAASAEPDIGVFTAVEGRVSVQRAQSPEAVPTRLNDTVLFKDVIETQKESRTKALLHDDSILTVGEHSRVEITEHLYDPSRSLRSVVVSLVQGRVRALVGKAFEGSGSKFEIHTPTAVAAARGTYFVVWHVDGASGIANIGTHGNVDFHSGGQTVSVVPGTFSTTPPGGGPPVAPSSMTAGNVPAEVTASVQGTEVPSNPEGESPSRTAAASGGTAPIPQPPQAPSGPQGSEAAPGSGNPLMLTSTVVPGVTVPAVTSGAAPPPPPPPPPSPPPSPPRFHPIPIDPSRIHHDNGLHLGQEGLQPGHGNPTPGNNQIPPGQGGRR
jgi:hypothetical protein